MISSVSSSIGSIFFTKICLMHQKLCSFKHLAPFCHIFVSLQHTRDTQTFPEEERFTVLNKGFTKYFLSKYQYLLCCDPYLQFSYFINLLQ